MVVQLLLYGVHELSEARVLPASEMIHNATEILGSDGKIGHLLAYSLAVVPTVWLLALWWKRRHSPRITASLVVPLAPLGRDLPPPVTKDR